MSMNFSDVDPSTGEVRASTGLPVVRHPFSRLRVVAPLEGESLTHQSHADSCDINKIIRRYERTGELPPARRPPQYGDVTFLQGDLTERISASAEVVGTARSIVQEGKAKRALVAAERAAAEAAAKAAPTPPT